MNRTLFQKIKDGLIVSCQALADEPLYGSLIMARVAKAAQDAGAVAIRANTTSDIRAIKDSCNLPIIGLFKVDYPDSPVYITPTIREVRAVAEAGADIIALDATGQKRPGGVDLEFLIREIRREFDVLLMGDISTLQEGVRAEEMGMDCVATTLSGYTSYSPHISGPDFDLVESLCGKVSCPVIAEGRIHSPALGIEALKLGAWAVTVGGAITRPQEITSRFASAFSRFSEIRSCCAIGIDIGGTKISGCLADYAGNILYSLESPTPRGREKLLDDLNAKISDLTQKAINLKITPVGIGVATAGRVCYPEGRVVFATDSLPGWTGTSVKESIRSDLPVIVDNDANLAAYGEWRLGAGIGYRNLVLLTVGTGLGGGIILNGQLVRGRDGNAGEIGHLVVDRNGEPCPCGKNGCLETIFSGSALARWAKESAWQGGDPHQPWGTRIVQAAFEGDLEARGFLIRMKEALDIAVEVLIPLVEPDLILLGGGIFSIGNPILREIFENSNSHPKIKIAKLANQAGMLGACQQLFDLSVHSEKEYF